MANEIYVNNGTTLSINGESGADYAFSVEGISSGAGRVSAQIDLGTTPRPHTYQWSGECQFGATPVQGKGLHFYLAFAPDDDATQIDGDVGNSDGALGDIDMRYNLTYLGTLISENAASNEKCVSSSTVTITTRYISVIAYNDSGAIVNSTDSNFQFKLQPKYSQGQ